jgi:hypothetical protein
MQTQNSLFHSIISAQQEYQAKVIQSYQNAILEKKTEAPSTTSLG